MSTEKTWIEVLAARAARHPERTALKYEEGGAWREMSYAELRRRVLEFARALLAAGFERGQALSVLSGNRWEWGVADLGTAHAGGVCAGIYPTNSAEQCAYILDHSETRFVVCDTAEQVDKIVRILPRLPKLEQIISLVPYDHERVVLWKDFVGRGEERSDQLEPELARRQAAIEPDDVFLYVYTSGTTGPPKCVQLSHANLLLGMNAVIHDFGLGEAEVAVSYLPTAHAADRVVVFYGSLLLGASTGYAAHVEDLPRVLAEVRPTLLLVVPRVLEKIHAKLEAGLAAAPPRRRAVFHWAVEVGKRVSAAERAGRPVSPLLRVQHALARRFVHRPFNQKIFGGRLRLMVSGAAPLAKELGELFDALGIPVCEGWAMSETAAVGTCNLPAGRRYGTVGRAVPGVEIRLDTDGEILIRGPCVMRGYYKNDAANQESFTPDGYFRTGDIGQFDADGYLTITDRKKDLLITSSGKNVAPQIIENLLKQSRFVSMAMAVGDRKNFVAALVTLDRDAVAEHLRERGLGELSPEAWPEHPEVQALVQRAVDAANAQLSRIESVRKFTILPRDFSIEEGELTPTLKLRRKEVTARYADAIERLYQG